MDFKLHWNDMSVKIEKKSKYIPMADENDNHFKFNSSLKTMAKRHNINISKINIYVIFLRVLIAQWKLMFKKGIWCIWYFCSSSLVFPYRMYHLTLQPLCMDGMDVSSTNMFDMFEFVHRKYNVNICFEKSRQ